MFIIDDYLPQHIIVSVIRYGVHVWRHFSFTLILVAKYNVVIVYGKPFVGVDRYAEKTYKSILL